MDGPVSFGSVNEEHLYRVLQNRGVEFHYQYALNGGRRVPGGQVIDFVILTPLRYALYVQGEYWHKASTSLSDTIKQSAAERAGFMVVLFSEAETDSYEAAMQAFSAKVGL
jgi:G:T-mismatch repair DNA endonuclease (very short patch repair protein)